MLELLQDVVCHGHIIIIDSYARAGKEALGGETVCPFAHTKRAPERGKGTPTERKRDDRARASRGVRSEKRGRGEGGGREE